MSRALTFSERMGYVQVRTGLQVESLEYSTRNRLWNVVSQELPKEDYVSDGRGGILYLKAAKERLYRELWHDYFRSPLSGLEKKPGEIWEGLQHGFISSWAWHECLGVSEFIAARVAGLAAKVNQVLEEEGVGFRIVQGAMVPITEPEQLEAMSAALSNPFVSDGAKAHLLKALELLKPGGPIQPQDIMRESIHAVEAQAKATARDPKASLGVALDKLKRDKQIHPAFAKALSQLYGFTSDEKGVRHAADGFDTNVTPDDARFFVVACSAFVSWLQAQS